MCFLVIDKSNVLTLLLDSRVGLSWLILWMVLKYCSAFIAATVIIYIPQLLQTRIIQINDCRIYHYLLISLSYSEHKAILIEIPLIDYAALLRKILTRGRESSQHVQDLASKVCGGEQQLSCSTENPLEFAAL